MRLDKKIAGFIRIKNKVRRMRKIQFKSNRWFTAISWCILLITFFLMIFILNQNIDRLINSDDASELILSNLLSQENNILSTEWYYSTELRVLNTQLIYAFFFKFITDWHLVRILSIATLYIVLLYSCFYMCKSIELEKYFPVIGTILLIPFSWDYLLVVLKAVYYIPHISITFITIGMMESFLQSNKRSKEIILFLAGTLLAILAGMGGPRQIIILYLPLFLASVIDCYVKLKGKQEDINKKYLIYSLILFLSSGVGYIINSKILSGIYHFQTYDTINFVSLDFQRLQNIIQGIINEYGYSTGNIFSSTTVVNVACAMLILIVIKSMIEGIKCYSTDQKYFRVTLFVLSGLAVLTHLYLFTNMDYKSRYFLPIIVMTFVSIFMYFKSVYAKDDENIICFSIVLVLFVLGLPQYKYCVSNDETYAFKDNQTDEFQLISKTLLENNCYNGYATFWNANILAELSDGKIEVWDFGNYKYEDQGLSGRQTLNENMFPWLQLKSHDTTSPTEKVFILLTTEQYDLCMWQDYLKEEDLIYHSEHFYLYCYEDMNHIPKEMLTENVSK